MGVFKYLQQVFRKPRIEVSRERLLQIRKEPATLRLPRPTKLHRARALGYRAKQGILIVRQRVNRGGHFRTRPIKGRRSRNQGKRLNLRKNYQLIAEERAGKKYTNCEVLNSYYLTKDGKHYWFEIILADRASPDTKADKRLSWVTSPKQKGRVNRGLTSAGRKMRGLRKKGKGAEKARPSRRSNSRRL